MTKVFLVFFGFIFLLALRGVVFLRFVFLLGYVVGGVLLFVLHVDTIQTK